MLVRCKITLPLEHQTGIQAARMLAWLLLGRLCSDKVLQGVWDLFVCLFVGLFVIFYCIFQPHSAYHPREQSQIRSLQSLSCPQLSCKSLNNSQSCSAPWKTLKGELEGHGNSLLQ